MSTIYILTDYKKHFSSKWDAMPYRSGMDKDLLRKLFKTYNYTIEYISFDQVYLMSEIKDQIFLYTSSEDYQYHYKSYIEDVILYLQEKEQSCYQLTIF